MLTGVNHESVSYGGYGTDGDFRTGDRFLLTGVQLVPGVWVASLLDLCADAHSGSGH